MTRYVWTAAVLQLAMAAAGHFVETVLTLGGVLGALIAFAVGVAYGTRVAGGVGATIVPGFAIGFVGSAVGLLLAILLGDATWLPLTYAPVAAAVSALLGVVIGRVRGPATA